MLTNTLIAECGGSKTDWCFINEMGEKRFFTSISFHPNYFDADFTKKLKTVLDGIDYTGCSLHFYSAGCLHAETKSKYQDWLEEFGFKKVSVLSDIHAAAHALNLQTGWGAICGTGSVVFYFENEKLKKLRGGYGPILGDEGGGLHFGKLLTKKYLHKKLHGNLLQFMQTEEKNKSLSIYLSTEEGLQRFAEYSTLTQNIQQARDIHQLNIQSFCALYLEDIATIGFVGSYAFHQKSFFSAELKKNACKPTQFIERPIENLVAYHTLLEN